MKLITSISGIRGIYGKTLTKSIASSYIESFSALQSRGKILLAQDSRPHGKEIYKSACDTLTKARKRRNKLWYYTYPHCSIYYQKREVSRGLLLQQAIIL